jgi:hypothetical protein
MSSSPASVTTNTPGWIAVPGTVPGACSAGGHAVGLLPGGLENEIAAIAAALQVFEDGLSQMRVAQPQDDLAGVVPAARDRAADQIASIAERANLLALDTAIGAARRGATWGRFAMAAETMRDHTAQTARRTDLLEKHIGDLRA